MSFTFSIRRIYRRHRMLLNSTGLVFCVAFISLIILATPPSDFTSGRTVTVSAGSTVKNVAKQLKEKKVIRSAIIYTSLVIILHDGKGVQAGTYFFEKPESVLKVAYRTAFGKEGLTKIKITIPEGVASPDVARLLAKNIPGFDSNKFRRLAREHEGRLFPDTYFFTLHVDPETVINEMTRNFEKQTKGLSLAIALSGRSEQEILTMASIVEEEANNTEDRKLIAGVLWKRIDAGMALQVDAPFFYIFGKTSSELTKTDLATTSKYNTYVNVGLPPAPISNPGLDAISATLNPKSSEYWFYLADGDGVTHYAVDHDGHVENKFKYLQ